MTRSRLKVNSFDNVELGQKGHIKISLHTVSLVHFFITEYYQIS